MTIAKFFPKKLNGFHHRTHRSKKGKKIFVRKERLDQEILSPVIEKDLLKLDIDELVSGKDLIKKAEGNPIKVRIKKPSYPTMRCENCYSVFKLDFEPLKESYKLDVLRCPVCKKHAYYYHWYPTRFIYEWYSAKYTLFRDLIKAKKATMQQFVD